MRQIDLSNYTVRVKGEEQEWVELPYEMKESLIELLFSRDLGLSGRELLARDDLARKINDCPDGKVLLEESDWNKLVQAVETVKGLGRPDVDFVRRILNAPEVEVEAKPAEAQPQPTSK